MPKANTSKRLLKENSEMVKRKPLGNIEKEEAESDFTMHVLHERPPQRPRLVPAAEACP